MRPFRPGVLVTGRHPEINIPIRAGCEDHIWETASKARKVKYGCGYVQSAQCLICGDAPTEEIDARWWSQKARTKHIKRALSHMAETVEMWEPVVGRLIKKLAELEG